MLAAAGAGTDSNAVPAEVIHATAMMPSKVGQLLPLLLQLQRPRRAQTAARPVANQQLQLQLLRDEAAEHRLKEAWTGAVEHPSTGSARPPCPGSAALPEVQGTFTCRDREIGPVFPSVSSAFELFRANEGKKSKRANEPNELQLFFSEIS